MTKPMYCPMSFCNPELSSTRGVENAAGITPIHCTPDCAWAISDDQNYGCAIAARHISQTGWGGFINSRSLEDDAE